MKLTDLIELFVDRESAPPQSSEGVLNAAREDTSSLADIARILRELDGQYGVDREPTPRRPPRGSEWLWRS